jgi:hypothetical protein
MDEALKKQYDVDVFMAQFKRAEIEHSPSLPGGDPTTYAYIPKLLMHPVKDGRIRLLWQVIAPYFVTILKVSQDDAEKYCREYLERCDELESCSKALEQVFQMVDHARIVDLKPPRLETLESTDPDLYQIITVAIQD